MLTTASSAFAQSQSTLTVVIAQTQDICDSVTSYSETVNSSSVITTTWIPVTLIGVCTNAAKGFNLSVNSLRSGKLQNGNDTQYVMPYQVKSVCASQANGPTGSRTDVCNITGVTNTFSEPFQPTSAFQAVFDTSGCEGITGQDRATCNNAFQNGVQVGLQIKLDDSVNSTAYPAGTYTDTIYYNLTGN